MASIVDLREEIFAEFNFVVEQYITIFLCRKVTFLFNNFETQDSERKKINFEVDTQNQEIKFRENVFLYFRKSFRRS